MKIPKKNSVNTVEIPDLTLSFWHFQRTWSHIAWSASVPCAQKMTSDVVAEVVAVFNKFQHVSNMPKSTFCWSSSTPILTSYWEPHGGRLMARATWDWFGIHVGFAKRCTFNPKWHHKSHDNLITTGEICSPHPCWQCKSWFLGSQEIKQVQRLVFRQNSVFFGKHISFPSSQVFLRFSGSFRLSHQVETSHVCLSKPRLHCRDPQFSPSSGASCSLF